MISPLFFLTITSRDLCQGACKVIVKKNNGEIKTYRFPYEGVGFHYELEHATQCIQQGLKESNLMTLDFSLRMARVAEEILQQGKVKYPESN